MKNNLIKFAVIGQGHIGKRHSEMIRRNESTELVAVCDIRSKKDCGIENIIENFYSKIDDLLENENIDVINICTPNGLHFEHSYKVLEKGVNVVIEKPITLNSNDGKVLKEKAQEKKKDIFCVMQNRYSPPSIWLKEVIDKRILGEIYMVQLICYWNRDERYYKKGHWHGTEDMDGGTLFTQFSHFLDMMYWLFGKIKNVQGKLKDFNHKNLTSFEDSGVLNFEFEKEGMGTFNFSTSLYKENLESSITIIGEKGTIKVAGQYMDKVEYCNIENYTMPKLKDSNPPNDYGDYKGSAQNHNYVIDNVVNRFLNNSKVNTPIQEGIDLIEIIEKMYKI